MSGGGGQKVSKEGQKEGNKERKKRTHSPFDNLIMNCGPCSFPNPTAAGFVPEKAFGAHSPGAAVYYFVLGPFFAVSDNIGEKFLGSSSPLTLLARSVDWSGVCIISHRARGVRMMYRGAIIRYPEASSVFRRKKSSFYRGFEETFFLLSHSHTSFKLPLPLAFTQMEWMAKNY